MLSTGTGHCFLVSFFQRYAVVVMIYFQDYHRMFAMRTDQRVISKRKKDCSSPAVKTAEKVTFFFRNSKMEFFIHGMVSGIKAVITDHLEMLFSDMTDETFDKIHNRNGFLNVLFIFVAIVMESNKITSIRINSGSSDDRVSKISADIFGCGFWITTVRLCINIEAMFMFEITSGRDIFKRWANTE